MSRMKGQWRNVVTQLAHTERERADDPLAYCPTDGKRRYPNEAAAQRAADYQMANDGPHLEVYPCSYCDSWHLTRG